MNPKAKFILSLLVTSLCLAGTYLSFMEVHHDDLWVLQETTTPPQPWIIMIGGLGLLALPWSGGWTIVYLLRLIYPKRPN
jgi:hypothetical protein